MCGLGWSENDPGLGIGLIGVALILASDTEIMLGNSSLRVPPAAYVMFGVSERRGACVGIGPTRVGAGPGPGPGPTMLQRGELGRGELGTKEVERASG